MEREPTESQVEVDFPKPSWLLIAVSLLNMAIGAVTAGVGLVGLELLWPISPFDSSCVMMIIAGLGSMIAQYLATFRGILRVVIFAAIAPGICLSALMVAVMVGPSMLSMGRTGSISQHEIISDIRLVLIPIVVYMLGSTWLNVVWYYELKRYAKKSIEKQRFALTFSEILGVCLLLALIIAPASYRAHTNPAMYLEHVSAAEVPMPLPVGSQNVTFQRNRFGELCATYHVEEDSLLAWLTTYHSAENYQQHEFNIPLEVAIPDAEQPIVGGLYLASQGFHATWSSGNRYFFVVYERPQGIVYYHEVILPHEN